MLVWVEYVWGAKGLAQLTAWHDGGDGEQNTADDDRIQHDLLRYDSEGRLLESWGPVAGPDGVWGTRDDGEALVKAYGPEPR